jgi:AraC-like DNA-binding protein
MNDVAVEASTLAAFTRLVGLAIADRGVDPDVVMRRSGIDPARLLRPGERVPRTAMSRLWANAVAETGDPAIGLAVGAYFSPAASRALGLGWLASSNLRQGLNRLSKYCGIVTSGVTMLLVETDDAVALQIVRSGDETDLAAEAIDAFFAINSRMCRLVTHRDFVPAAVFLRREDPGVGEAYREALGVDPVFGSEYDAFQISREEALTPLPGADAELATELDRLSERYLAVLESGRMSASVREILEELLPTGSPTLENVARVMQRTPKQIQRKLAAEGLGFRELHEQTRKAMALRLVRDPDVSLSRIAQMLGFSDQSNFNRAFRRWAGSSPGSFRKRADSSDG